MDTSFADTQPTSSTEIERLLNPAYCACIIARYTFAYRTSSLNTSKRGLSYPLIYLCLPITLHSPTRNEINKHSRTYGLHRFIRENPAFLVRFAERVEGFTPITRSALSFGIKYGLLQFDTQQATISSEDNLVRRITISLLDEESFQPVRAAELIGNWFSQLTVAEVFLHLGIQPQGVVG